MRARILEKFKNWEVLIDDLVFYSEVVIIYKVLYINNEIYLNKYLKSFYVVLKMHL